MKKRYHYLKKLSLLMCLFLLLLMNVTYIHADGNNIVDNTMSIGSDSWEKHSQNNRIDTEFVIDESIKHSRNSSMRITNRSQDYSRYSLPLSLETDSDYKISCWVKTKEIGIGKTGACLSVEGKDIFTIPETYIKPFSNNGKPVFEYFDPKTSEAGPRHVSSTDLVGNNGVWQKLNLHIGTGETTGDVTVFFELGRPGKENIGSAWYTDLVVEKVEPTTRKNTIISLQIGALVLFAFILWVVLYPRKAINKGKRGNASESLNAGAINPASTRNQKIIVWAIFAVAILVRLIISAGVEGHILDAYCFKSWSSVSAENLFNTYSSGVFIDYPPLYVYFLALLGKIAGTLNVYTIPWLYNILIKLPSIMAELLTGFIIYKAAGTRNTFKMCVFITSIYLFSATFILDTCAWAQIDSLLALIIIVALLFLQKGKYELSSVFFALAILLKPQGIIMLPILFFALVKNRKIKTFITSFLSALATVFVVVLPFALKEGPFWIMKLYMNTLGGYISAVQGAYNLFALVGGSGTPDDTILFIFSYRVWGLFFIVLSTCFVGYLYLKSKDDFIPFLTAFVLYTAVYMLSSRIHERYLLPSLVMALFLYIYSSDKRVLLLYGGFGYALFQCIDQGLYKTMNVPIELGSAISLGLFIWLIFIAVDMVNKGRNIPIDVVEERDNGKNRLEVDIKKKKHMKH